MDSSITRVSGSPAVSAATGDETASPAGAATARAAAAGTVQSSAAGSVSPHASAEATKVFGASDSGTHTLKVSVDKQSGVIVRIVDASGKTVRQVPPEELVELAKRLDEAIGLLFDKKA